MNRSCFLLLVEKAIAPAVSACLLIDSGLYPLNPCQLTVQEGDLDKPYDRMDAV